VTVGNRTEKNPLAADRQTWKDGQKAFSHYCVACHGMDGRTTGVPFAGRISPPIPPLDSGDVQSYTDGQLKWILDNGISPSGMPGSKGTLNDEEEWSIVVFLRHLPPADSQGVPEMYTH
jgi:mono/diheme cytochrome c family protein